MSKQKWNSRERVIDFLEDYSANIKEQIDSRKTKNTLLKSYIFETFDESIYELKRFNKEEITIPNLFPEQSQCMGQVDERMYYLSAGDETIGFFEQVNDRFLIFYSLESSDASDKFTRDAVRNSPVLDSLWISGKMFNQILKKMSKEHHPNRYTKIKFEFNSFFEGEKYIKGIGNSKKDISGLEEHKASSVSLTEELGDISYKIEGVRKYFSSFHAIGQLRFPSNIGRGGHDFYQNGKVTNRSDSFKDHRFQVKKMINSYQNITEILESKTWIDLEKVKSPNQQFLYNYEGSPVTIVFKEPLKEHIFENFINYTFQKGKEPFRIFGEIIRVSNNRAHIYGIDLHLWQKVMMDLSREQFTIFLPKGTCGNTIHRLITNIQRYLNPELTVYIGNDNYEEIIQRVIESGV
ncbi:hypothetical protein [Ectobacillus antri]|uniref:hypothetical protein n=1 Tax=Ectobacillus antri TaxID=2486280 RepID=UPI000F59A8D5|nr:hypothetical protein [Ectobacillus antri]